jgi:hypothetical protein
MPKLPAFISLGNKERRM